MKKFLLVIILLPYIVLETLWTVIFGSGFGSYRYSNTLLEIYEKMGFESYVSSIANYEEDTGRCKRFYGIARKSYLNKNQNKRLQGRYGNRF
ncbi:MAG: hypothetical protein K0R72_1267 [Clostridia bacterium]|jgi:hypothetical protein|nr:hypothetical protein [Clostridia bacterium]